MTKFQLKINSITLYQFIDSKNSHGRKTFMAKLEELGLANTQFGRMSFKDKTNQGKNILKDLWLKTMINNLDK